MARYAWLRLKSKLTVASLMGLMAVRSVLVRSKVTGDQSVVVCMTSHRPRLKMLFMAIESIARGTMKPQRMILWLAPQDMPRVLAKSSIRRLQSRGLEVLECPDYRSFKKFYPYVLSKTSHDIPMVIADDDVLYPGDWLEQLMAQHTEFPHNVIAHACQWIKVVKGEIQPYVEWDHSSTAQPLANNYPTGVSGVLYPAPMLDILRDAGDGFLTVAPLSDDTWLHYHSIRSGFPVRQVESESHLYYGIRGTQKVGLWALHGHKVDGPISALYGKSEIRQMLGEDEPLLPSSRYQVGNDSSRDR